MKTNLLNINKIFTDRIFRIPDYQRGYAWTNRQLKDFWNDLLQLESGKNHYVGVLTLEDVDEEVYKNWQDDLWIIESKSFSPFYIVDGQQRLTTTIILIQSILECNNKNEKINYFTNEDIRKRFIYDSKDEGISRSYIFGYEKDNPSYEFLKTKVFLEESENSHHAEETIYTHNLEYAKRFFTERLAEMDLVDVEKLYKKLTQNLLFNIYSMSDDIDVYITFETMNNRGKPLSILELLKNRLIFLSTKLDTDEHERNRLRKSINEAWKAIYHHLGRNKDNHLIDDVFLLNHFFYYFGKDLFRDDEDISYRYRHRNLRAEYQEYLLENLFTIKNIAGLGPEISDEEISRNVDLALIYDYVKSLKASVEIWFKILNPDLSDFSKKEKEILSSIFRMERNPQRSSYFILVLVFYVKTKNKTHRVDLLYVIEKMIFFSSMLDYGWSYYWGEESFLESSINLAAGKISCKEVIESLNSRFEGGMSNKRLRPEIIKYFKSRGFYSWPALKYFLFEYELHLKGMSKTKRDKLSWDALYGEKFNDYQSVEHIYPQSARKACWASKFSHYTPKERNSIKNSLGNLLPLSVPKNSSLNNKCFDSKKSREDDTVGYAYGCYSENEVAQKEEWTAKEILERGIKMAGFFEDRWGFEFSSQDEMLDFLGIPFVVKKEKIILQKRKRITNKGSRTR